MSWHSCTWTIRRVDFGKPFFLCLWILMFCGSSSALTWTSRLKIIIQVLFTTQILQRKVIFRYSWARWTPWIETNLTFWAFKIFILSKNSPFAWNCSFIDLCTRIVLYCPQPKAKFEPYWRISYGELKLYISGDVSITIPESRGASDLYHWH